MTGYWRILGDTGHRQASPHHAALQVASSLSFPRVPHERRNAKKSVGVSASPLQPIRHECRRSVTHGGSWWAWPPCFMTRYLCGNTGKSGQEKRTSGPETTYALPDSVSIILWGPALPSGCVNRCVRPCARVRVRSSERFTPKDVRLLDSDVFNPETLSANVSFTFPGNQVKSFKLIRFYYFKSVSQSL